MRNTRLTRVRYILNIKPLINEYQIAGRSVDVLMIFFPISFTYYPYPKWHLKPGVVSKFNDKSSFLLILYSQIKFIANRRT